MIKDLLKRFLRIILLNPLIYFILLVGLEYTKTEDEVVRCGMPHLLIIIVPFVVFLFSLPAISLFLNLNREIREHPLLRFLSFFLLPIIVMLGVFWIDRLLSTDLVLWISLIPFYAVIFREYYLFNKKFPLHQS